MPNNKDDLDGKDRRLLTAIVAGMSYDTRVFDQRFRQEIDRLTRGGLDEQSIIRVLEQDFASNGRIFGELRNSIKRGVIGGINQAFRPTGEMGQNLRWVAISKNICDDCQSVAGEIDTWENWQSRGVPGSGWSICKEYCYCQLIPEDIEIDDSITL
tara:strand:- start:1786 stop:2253 length:468 start_codon:yes stop_codon:yes gene_type:complete